MELAKENTSNNLETCGILGASFVRAVGGIIYHYAAHNHAISRFGS
jgi:hypothetical protein